MQIKRLLPLLDSGQGRVVPMLTLTALVESSGLRIRTEVVDVPVWQLPLPGGEQLELVIAPAGPAQLGSPATEHDRQTVMDWFAANRDGCRDGVDVEALRPVRLQEFVLVRQPISQGQWRTVVEAVDQIERELDDAPGAAKPESILERYGQTGVLAVDSVSRHQGREWLGRLNRWLQQQWPELKGSGVAPSWCCRARTNGRVPAWRGRRSRSISAIRSMAAGRGMTPRPIPLPLAGAARDGKPNSPG